MELSESHRFHAQIPDDLAATRASAHQKSGFRQHPEKLLHQLGIYWRQQEIYPPCAINGQDADMRLSH